MFCDRLLSIQNQIVRFYTLGAHGQVVFKPGYRLVSDTNASKLSQKQLVIYGVEGFGKIDENGSIVLSGVKGIDYII